MLGFGGAGVVDNGAGDAYPLVGTGVDEEDMGAVRIASWGC